jgi:hypothetical protein
MRSGQIGAQRDRVQDAATVIKNQTTSGSPKKLDIQERLITVAEYWIVDMPWSVVTEIEFTGIN